MIKQRSVGFTEEQNQWIDENTEFNLNEFIRNRLNEYIRNQKYLKDVLKE